MLILRSFLRREIWSVPAEDEGVRCRAKAYNKHCSTFTMPIALSPLSTVLLSGPDLLKVSMLADLLSGSCLV